MNRFTDLQCEVFDKAKEKLMKNDWFRGVCLDNFPSHADIIQRGVESCVDSVYDETAMWDARDLFKRAS